MGKNKTVLITGCSTGIGLEAAKTLQARGFNVVASVRQQKDITVLKQQGLVHVISLDLRSSESIDAGLSEALEISGGRLYAIFNNGAYGQPGAVEDLSRNALRKQFETNLFGTHELTVKALPYLLKEDDARIIQNSSILGFVAMPMRGAYIASKFALEGLTDALRIELSETNVKVSIIEPGPILTNFRNNAMAALEENVDIGASRHQGRYEGAFKRLKKKGATSKFTLSADAVVAKLVHALESPRPKIRYYVTFPTYLFAFLRHVLPASMIDKIMISAAKAEG